MADELGTAPKEIIILASVGRVWFARSFPPACDQTGRHYDSGLDC